MSAVLRRGREGRSEGKAKRDGGLFSQRPSLRSAATVAALFIAAFTSSPPATQWTCHLVRPSIKLLQEQLHEASQRAMEASQGWQRPAEPEGFCCAIRSPDSGWAAPVRGELIALPEGLTRMCAGQGGSGGGSPCAGGGSAGLGGRIRCPADGCRYVGKKGPRSIDAHWRQKHLATLGPAHEYVPPELAPSMEGFVEEEEEAHVEPEEEMGEIEHLEKIIEVALQELGDMKYDSFETQATLQRVKDLHKKVTPHPPPLPWALVRL